jgi:hypothetical protein
MNVKTERSEDNSLLLSVFLVTALSGGGEVARASSLWRIILAVAVTYLLFMMLLLAAILAVGFLGFEVSVL